MELCETFLRLVREKINWPDVLHTEETRDKWMTCFSVYLRMIRVEFVYSRKWENLAPPSVLYARIYFNKNDPLYLHLPELIAYLQAEDYRACYFPCIASQRQMSDCLDALMEILQTYIPLAERLCSTGQDRAIMERWAEEGFFEDPKRQDVNDGKVDWDTMLLVRSLQEGIMVGRHTEMEAYQAFLKGDREKAVRLYEKLQKNGLSLYEKGLLAFLRSDESRYFVPMPPQCYTFEEYRKAEKGDKIDLCGVLLLYGGFAAFFCGLLAVINGVLARGTCYYYGIQWWFGFLLAIIPAVFCYFTFQRPLRQKLGGQVAFYDIQKNQKFTQWFSGTAFALAMIGCLWFSIAVASMSSRYYDTYAIYYTEQDTMRRFEYTQVTEVCYIQARYNVYGDRVARPSYVLILDDGRQIDLDCECALAQQREMIRCLWPDISIRELDSDRDLPGS